MTRSILAGILALAGGSLFADDGQVRDKAAELVRQLSSEDPSVRERATADLEALGPEAAIVLEEAGKSTDPEVVWRARRALGRIRGEAVTQEKAPTESASPKLRSQGPSTSVQIRVIGPGSYSLSQDGRGHIALTITERDASGKRHANTYEADSTEEFLRKYPEIAERFGIGRDVGPAPRVVRPPAPVPQDNEQRDAEANGDPGAPQADFGAEVIALESSAHDGLDPAGQDGVIVVMIMPGSGAEKAGLERHDVILALNHEPVKTRKGFLRLLLEGTAARAVEMEIVRKGERRTLLVEPSLLER